MFCQTLKPVLKPVAQMVQQGCASIVGEPTPTVYDYTDGISAAEAFDTYTRASTHVIADDSGNLIEVPANAVALTWLRPVRNLWPSADGSDTPSTQTITVVSGRVYQLRIGAESASGATAVCSGAFTGTLTGDGADIQTFTAGKTATSTSLTVTITGSVRKIQLEDITHRAFDTTGDELVTNGGFDTDSDWTKLSATIADGVATFVGEVSQNVTSSALGLVQDNFYVVELDSTGVTTGSVVAFLGTNSSSDPKYAKNFGIANGRLRTVLQASSSDFVRVGLTESDTGSIDNVTVKALHPQARVPSEYVSVGVESAPYHGYGIDGLAYYATALANTVDASGIVTEATGSAVSGALDYQPAATNLADGGHDFSGGADTITLPSTGNYTLSVYGTAAVTIAAGTATITGGAQATEGSPVTINCTSTGTVTLTLDSGTLDEVDGKKAIQLEAGTVDTALIPTSGATASRAATTAEYDVPAANTTTFTVTGLDASLDPDPSDDTEREVEETDWSGTVGDVFAGPVQIKSISVVDNT